MNTRILDGSHKITNTHILDDGVKNLAAIFLAACLGISYLLPFHFYPFTTFYNELLVIFGVAIAVAMIGKEKIASVHIPWIAGLPVGLAGTIALQTMCGMLTVNWDAVFPIAYFIDWSR